MRNLIAIFLVSTFILVSCSPAPAAITPISMSSPTTLGPTATPGSTLAPAAHLPRTQVPGSAGVPCKLLHFPVTPEATLGAGFEGRGHVSGAANAPVTIIAFSDYQCLQCALLAASLRQIPLTHPKDVRLIYLHTPQADRDKDNLAIQAVEAADLQGKFWEMHDLLFEKQAEWSTLVPADFEAWTTAQAAGLGVDAARFRSDFEGPAVAERLQQAIQFTAGVQPFAPPLLFVNSASPYIALADFASLDTVVRMDALEAHQFSACPPESINPLKQYAVTLHTAKGDVVLQLYPEKAPDGSK